MAELVASARVYVLTGRQSYLAPYHPVLPSLPRSLERLRDLTRDNARQQASLDALDPVLAERLEFSRRLVDARGESGLQAALELLRSGRGEELLERTRELLAEMERRERELLAQRTERSEAGVRLAVRILLLGGAVSLAVTEGTSDAVYLKDLEGRYRMANEAAARILGLRVSDLIGRTDCELFTEAEGRAIHALDLQILESGHTRSVETVGTSAGVTRTFLSTKGVFRGPDGRPAGVVGIGRDISERKEREQAQLNAQLSSSLVELEARTREIEILGESSSLLQACKTAEEAYQVITHSLERLFAQSSGFVGVTRASRDGVEIVSAFGALPLEESVFQPEQCWALRLGRSYEGSGVPHTPRCAHPGAAERPYRCIPLIAAGEAIGVLHAGVGPGAAGLSETDRRLAHGAAEQIALALANLGLREMLRNQSIRDPLTGLFNRRFMEESLSRELLRAERKQRPVGVLLFDIDHFKSFNDQFGHAVGDLVLREVAGFLEQRMRGDDVVCRFGGEELLVLMPESPPEDSLKRAEQLRQGIKSLPLRHEGRPLGALTVSCGVASFPQHGSTPEDLLRAADHALYAAKHSGRDRVEVAS